MVAGKNVIEINVILEEVFKNLKDRFNICFEIISGLEWGQFGVGITGEKPVSVFMKDGNFCYSTGKGANRTDGICTMASTVIKEIETYLDEDELVSIDLADAMRNGGQNVQE
jgi:hypothetical protein